MTPETPQSSERVASNRRLLPFIFDLVEKVSLGRVLPFAWLVFGALVALGMWGPEKYRDVFVCLWMGHLCGIIAYLRASTHQAEIEQLNDAAGCAWWVVALVAILFMLSPPHLGFLETVGLATLVFWSVWFSCHLGIKFRLHHHRKTKNDSPDAQ